jgi:predicted nuclease of predicted toxin-antitoxin system
MILADENVHGYIIETLRKEGFEVASIAETASGIKDDKVIELALQLGYLLLTEDKDFGDWVFAHHVKNLRVLFLRYAFHDYEEITRSLLYLLKTQELQYPFFATITTKKIRVRQL